MIIAFLLLSACRTDKTAQHIFTYCLELTPQNLDPQLAQNAAEMCAALNAFEGLTRLLNGKPELAAAQSCDISSDGLVYSFTLNSKNRWSNEEPVTAADFVFGFRRALSPELDSPLAMALFSVKNAQEVHSGLLHADSLGVTATGVYALEITLAAPNREFLRTLASPAAFPCNKKFFEETKGHYGLEAKYIISNGPFSVTFWDGEKLRLRPNKHYEGKNPPQSAGLTVFFDADGDKRFADLKNEPYDAAVIPASFAESAHKEGFNVRELWNSLIAVCVNRGAAGTGNPEIALALKLALEPEFYAENMPSFFKPADGVIPPDAAVFGQKIRTFSGGATALSPNPDAARTKFNKAISTLPGKTFPQTAILFPEEEGMRELTVRIAHSWQKNLSAYINLEGVPAEEFRRRLDSGEYAVALCPLLSGDGVSGFLTAAGKASGENLESLITQTSKADSAEFAAAKIREAEQILTDSAFFAPVAFTFKCVAVSNRITFGEIENGSPDFWRASVLKN
ncbi:MAG: peptide ABC transporter substrate-binding protein [Oscillospiraceae bacterium]|nr:peptide ABC transporter substrate-binding protein [Oscillospiraceae bacterium]